MDDVIGDNPVEHGGDVRVDVLVSAWNEERHLDRCLSAVLAQDYPHDLLSVVFVDGGSSDGTVAVARARAAADPRLRVVSGRGRLSLPAALNLGIAMSSAELVAKIDCHGYPEHDFVRRAVNALSECDADVAVIGGRPEQQGETAWGRAVARARVSRFGTGGSVYAGTSVREFVDTVQCGVYKRSALDVVGGFDPAMAYGEDDELNWRLRAANYRILLDTSIRFHYVTRATLGGAFRQYRNYGKAKVRVGAAHPRFIRPWHLAPAAFVAAGSLCMAASGRSRTARRAASLLAAAYSAAAVTAAVSSPGPKDVQSLARVGACFAAIHSGYGTGMLIGLASEARRRAGSSGSVTGTLSMLRGSRQSIEEARRGSAVAASSPRGRSHAGGAHPPE